MCLPDNSFNAANYFLTVFGRPESSSACECERSMDASLSQSLHLLNSKDIQGRISSDSGRAAKLAQTRIATSPPALGNSIGSPSGGNRSCRRSRPLSSISRAWFRPRKEGKDAAETEAARVKARREAWEDVVWALLNTKEFLFNH